MWESGWSNLIIDGISSKMREVGDTYVDPVGKGDFTGLIPGTGNTKIWRRFRTEIKEDEVP